ncbi:hypothetical protein PROFUN_03121 [Planoprotostelium fungivorum]|uniref:Uncharacterized protein n=1 Tax=Planoprotostelium fungivorum TaxID=1890364 RepID=A0A2P6NQA5_9EUKA|nr:hypothetical protein PROFUN_03121 [Planoprotostelium fungivorum]
MRGALSLFLLCVALSQAISYETSTTTIPTTGIFSPIYRADPPALFRFDVGGGYGVSVFVGGICDGRLVESSATACSTYQAVLGTTGEELDFSPDSLTLVVTQIDIVNITLGQNYTSENDARYELSVDVPHIYSFALQDSIISNLVGFSNKLYVAANTTLITTGSVYPLYATTYPTTYDVQQADMFGSTFVYEGVMYSAPSLICSSQDAVVLLDQFQTLDYNFLPAQTCNFFSSFLSAFNATVISAQTPATLSASESAMYDVNCQTYGNSTAKYVLIKLINTDATSKGGIINGLKVKSQPGAFDIAFNCGAENTIDLNIEVNGPYNEVVSYNVDQLRAYSLGFYQVNVTAGIISDPFSSSLLKELGVQGCSTEMSYNYFGNIENGVVDLCYTVNDSMIIDVPTINTGYVIRPPEGYCIRSDGIPSNSSSNVFLLSDTSSSFLYEDDNTALYTVTCSDDIFYVRLSDVESMRINFTLVPVRQQGVYGQTYDVDGLLAIQYPPLKASVGILSTNVTGSAHSLSPVVNPRMLGKRAVSANFLTGSNSLQTSNSLPTQFIVLAQGQGQMTTNLATSDGLNVGYDTTSTTSSSSSTSSTSSTESSSSTSSDESTSSTSSEESTSSTSSVESTSSTSSDESTSSTSSDESTSSTSSDESTSSTSSDESTSSTSSGESTSSTSSTSSDESTSSTSSDESTSSTSSTTLDTTSEEPSTESPSTSSVSSTTSTTFDTTSEELSTESPSTFTTSVRSTTSTTSVQSTTSSTSSTSSTSFSSTSSVVTSSESEENGTDSSTTTTTSASVSFTDTSVSPDNISNDSSMVKVSVLSVVVMALLCLFSEGSIKNLLTENPSELQRRPQQLLSTCIVGHHSQDGRLDDESKTSPLDQELKENRFNILCKYSLGPHNRRDTCPQDLVRTAVKSLDNLSKPAMHCCSFKPYEVQRNGRRGEFY